LLYRSLTEYLKGIHGEGNPSNIIYHCALKFYHEETRGDPGGVHTGMRADECKILYHGINSLIAVEGRDRV
jgi:hypothetical protein